MVRGDAFSGAELGQLFAHPLLRPLLRAAGGHRRGHPRLPHGRGPGAGGPRRQARAGEAGREAAASPTRTTCSRPATGTGGRPTASAASGCSRSSRSSASCTWSRSRRRRTARRRTATPGSRSTRRRRWRCWARAAGQSRDGVTKTFHDVGIIAEVAFRHHGWTPAQVEGLTLDGDPLPHAAASTADAAGGRAAAAVQRGDARLRPGGERGARRRRRSRGERVARWRCGRRCVRETCALLGIANVRRQEAATS